MMAARIVTEAREILGIRGEDRNSRIHRSACSLHQRGQAASKATDGPNSFAQLLRGSWVYDPCLHTSPEFFQHEFPMNAPT
jgi:hypothetical protein